MDAQSKIIVYGAEWCGFCHTAMDYFDKKGVKYTYVDVDHDRQGAVDAVTKSGQRAIPVIDINGDIVVGFNIAQINQALSAHQLA